MRCYDGLVKDDHDRILDAMTGTYGFRELSGFCFSSHKPLHKAASVSTIDLYM